MMDNTNLDRRTVLRGVGTVAIAGALAGCGGDGGDDGDSGDGGDGTPTEDASTPTPTESMGVPSEVEEYLSDVDNYDSLEDMTGSGEVTVEVGVSGNGGNFAFAPPAIRIDTGTTVVWEWTGNGGSHNVAAEDGSFESELVDEEGFTFEQTFDSSGSVRYFCTPHKGVGMKGAIVVG